MRETEYLFAEDHAERVADLLAALDIPAVVDEFEPGMFQVRIDPIDRTTERGWVAVAGQGNDIDRAWGWFVIETALDTEGFPHASATGLYQTTSTVVPLGVPVAAEPARVAIALMGFLSQRS